MGLDGCQKSDQFEGNLRDFFVRDSLWDSNGDYSPISYGAFFCRTFSAHSMTPKSHESPKFLTFNFFHVNRDPGTFVDSKISLKLTIWA